MRKKLSQRIESFGGEGDWERRQLLRLCGGSELSAGDPPIGPSTDAALAHYMDMAWTC